MAASQQNQIACAVCGISILPTGSRPGREDVLDQGQESLSSGQDRGVDERMNGWKDDTQTVGKQRRLRGGTTDGWIDGRMAS